MRFPRIALLLLPALVLGARTGEAQTITSPIRHIEARHSVGGYVGHLWPSTSVQLSDTVALPLAPGSAPVFGVRYALRVSGPLSLHASVGYSPSQRELYVMDVASDTLRVEPVPAGEQVGVPIVLGEMGLHFSLTGARTWNGLAPFVLATGGFATDMGRRTDEELRMPLNERFDFGPAFALRAAIGTDWFVADRLSVRLELQNRLWRVAAPSGFTGRTTARQEWNSVPGVTVGAAVHF